MTIELAETTEVEALWAALVSGRVSYLTYAALSAAIGRPHGSMAEVSGDPGTHVDPVSALTVDNNGVYRRVEAGWQRISSTPPDVLSEAEAARDAAVVAKTAAEAANALVQLKRAIGDVTTQAIPTNLAGALIAATLGPLFLGVNEGSADGLTIDAGKLNFPPGIAFRRYRGLDTAPTPVVAGDQLGYLDFRAYNEDSGGTDAFFNCGSIDMIVDSLGFADGEPPRTAIRFGCCYNNDGGREVGRFQPYGASGAGLWIGASEPDDTEVFYLPKGASQPRLFVVSNENDWVAMIEARAAAGGNNLLRLDTETGAETDFVIAAFANEVLQASLRANGNFYTLGQARIGTAAQPAFGATVQLTIEQATADWALGIECTNAVAGNNFGIQMHLLTEGVNDYAYALASGAGAGTIKFSVRGTGAVHTADAYYVDGVKVVGNQAAAIADATDAATAISQLNLLLAAARAHGLIAT